MLSAFTEKAALSFFMLRMTLGYVSDHWAQYVSHNQGSGLALQPYSMEKLQVEFDETRAVPPLPPDKTLKAPGSQATKNECWIHLRGQLLLTCPVIEG